MSVLLETGDCCCTSETNKQSKTKHINVTFGILHQGRIPKVTKMGAPPRAKKEVFGKLIGTIARLLASLFCYHLCLPLSHTSQSLIIFYGFFAAFFINLHVVVPFSSLPFCCPFYRGLSFSSFRGFLICIFTTDFTIFFIFALKLLTFLISQIIIT